MPGRGSASSRDLWLAHVEFLLEQGLFEAAAYSLTPSWPGGDVEDARIWSLAAIAQLGRGDPSAAVDFARHACVVEPHNAETHRLAAVCLWRLGDVEAAAEAADLAVGCDPAEWLNHALFSELARRIPARRVQALQAAMRACELRPDDPNSQALVGAAYAAIFDDTHAEPAYQHALALDSDHPGARFGLGMLALRHLFLGKGARQFIRLSDDPEVGVLARFNLGVAVRVSLALVGTVYGYLALILAATYLDRSDPQIAATPWIRTAYLLAGTGLAVVLIIWRCWRFPARAWLIGLRQVPLLSFVQVGCAVASSAVTGLSADTSQHTVWIAAALWTSWLGLAMTGPRWWHKPPTGTTQRTNHP